MRALWPPIQCSIGHAMLSLYPVSIRACEGQEQTFLNGKRVPGTV